MEDEGPPQLKNNDKESRIKDENSLKVRHYLYGGQRSPSTEEQ